jgi:hypothetical protein
VTEKAEMILEEMTQVRKKLAKNLKNLIQKKPKILHLVLDD